MKKCVQKLMSLLLALSMVFSLISVGASAASVVDSGTCGENLTWTLTSDGTLTISGTGEMEDYGYFKNQRTPWFSRQDDIRVLLIEEGVSSIGCNALYNCTSLAAITIPRSVISIRSAAFEGCTSLTTVTIPDSVGSIGSSAFENCDGLTTIFIPAGVTDIGDCAFNNCDSLSGIHVDNNNPNYTSIDGILFDKGCTVLLQYPNGNLANVYSIPNSVTRIGNYAFHGCVGLTAVAIPDSVTKIGTRAFRECTALTAVTIPSSVTNIGYGAFDKCVSLTSVTIPDSVTDIDRQAFARCTSLVQVSFGKNAPGVYTGDFLDVTFGEIFWMCDSIQTIYIDSENPYYTVVDGVVFSKDLATLIYYPPGKTDASYTIPDTVTRFGSDSVTFCNYLTKLIIPDSVISVDEGATSTCRNLTSITIPASVTSIGAYAFGMEFYQDSSGKGSTYVKGFAIKGEPGSAAETYAIESGLTFIDVNSPSLTLDANGGQFSNKGETMAIGGFQKGDTYEPIFTEDTIPVREGYTFAGWYTEEGHRISPYNCFTNQEDETLYAHWTKEVKVVLTNVEEDHWAYDSIIACIKNGVFDVDTVTGTVLESNVVEYVQANFPLEKETTRSDFVRHLYKVYGEPDVTAENVFKDISSCDTLTKKAITWAYHNGITNGTSATTFDPNTPVTREQYACFLYRAMNKFGETAKPTAQTLSSFADYKEVSDWAIEAMSWVVSEKIILGTGDNRLSPKLTTSYAMESCVLSRAYRMEYVIGNHA